MRAVLRPSLALVIVGLAVGCGLNPQPEPPSLSESRGGDGGSTDVAGGGGGFGLGGSGNLPTGTGGSPSTGGATQTAAGAGGSAGGAGAMAGTGGTTSPGSDAGAPDDAGIVVPQADAEPPLPEAGAACVQATTSSLPGVSIHFPEQPCTFTLAEAQAGVTFTYEVVVEEAVSGVITEPQDSGRCGTSSPGGLFVLEHIEGGGRSYCVCDVGLCPPGPLDPVTLAEGTYSATFSWDGVSWTGPSDTGNPKGPAFPAGDYTLTVRGTGGLVTEGGLEPYEVTGTFAITLVP